MNKPKNIKPIIVTILVVVVAIFLYKTLIKSSKEDVQTERRVGADIVDLSNSLKSVTLDPEIFSSPLYKRLVDFSIEIPRQDIGRRNPFDQIGR